MPVCFVFHTNLKFSQVSYSRTSKELSKPKQNLLRVVYTTQAVFFKETEKTKSSEPVTVTSIPSTASKSVSFDGQLNKSPVSSESSRKNISLDSTKIKEYSSKLLSDVSSRPAYYGQIALATLVGIICLQIIGSIEESLNHIPILPSLLELVGIVYTAFFAWRYVSYPETRSEVEKTLRNIVSKLNLNK
ncbi:hypothetical protein Gasu2_27110 [Galdieria sulphuraria]|uniref:Cyanobacterial aminoacyl-tRNA synthetase CAAD domain-containing protein n=1 Tax=Galdieria sulphuraria TaxID=130081 RepID=M2Y342_GALSU|nr:uncharacterized protein Gasu_23930 [Galdieria sulphuraria]EME30239.1 hypothetical protein Gasu_23930 [Galdieria sulphuraria]GJD08407.1 hypothetical protein Gasu2_27110 [Galdieria sulphuraria]|eukprot:XP_005706759.1 hypothetical protein Gasu_23930 [Galdieria sulphuraria]